MELCIITRKSDTNHLEEFLPFKCLNLDKFSIFEQSYSAPPEEEFLKIHFE
jgi:hypothetical protein